MAMSKVSVRREVSVGRRSEPINRKLIVSLLVSGGSGVGLEGGAAWVGNNCSLEMVAVGET